MVVKTYRVVVTAGTKEDDSQDWTFTARAGDGATALRRVLSDARAQLGANKIRSLRLFGEPYL